MKRMGLWALCALLALSLAACKGRELPALEPDPRDIDPERVAYIIYGGVVVEDRELIGELTDSLNHLRPELGTYDEESHYPTHRFAGWSAFPGERPRFEGRVDFFDREGQVLAQAAYWDGRVYRDHYRHPDWADWGGVLFDREWMEALREGAVPGVSPVISLYYECMYPAEKLWIEDLETGGTVVVTDPEPKEELTDYFARMDFRVEEDCPEDAAFRYRLRWTYTENDDLLEEVKLAPDGRIERHGKYAAPLYGDCLEAVEKALALALPS